MSLRAIAFLGLYGLALFAAFVFPPAGVWGFLFESNHSPPFNWWGGPFMKVGHRWSFYIGAVMILTVLIHYGRFRWAPVFKHPQTILLVLFSLNTCVVTFWAYDVDASWKEASDLLKWLLVYICIIKTHSNRKWLPVILMIYILSAIDMGWEATFHGKSGRSVKGGCTTIVGDENFKAAHCVALLPLVALYGVSPNTKRWYRYVCLLGAPLMLNVIAHAQSRGAFLALLAMAMAMLFFTKGRLRALTILGLVVGSLIAVRLFHEQFWGRMTSITTEEQTGTGRTEAWKDAWSLAQKNPFGYGGEAFDRGLKTQSKTTHNMFFECLVAWGAQGTFLFFAFIFFTMWDCWRLKRRLWRRGHWPQSQASLESLGIFVGLVSMMVASVFLNRMRWELWWIFAAYVVCLKNIQHAPVPQQSAYEEHFAEFPRTEFSDAPAENVYNKVH